MQQATPAPLSEEGSDSDNKETNKGSAVDDVYTRNVPTSNINGQNPYYFMPVQNHKSDLEISMGLIETKNNWILFFSIF